jgi:dUTP pyrophosphatase
VSVPSSEPVVNSPGTVDAGYRGEIKVCLLNTDPRSDFTVAIGDRIAQLIVSPVVRAQFIAVERLPGSQRGDGGFGSTGVTARATATTPPHPIAAPHPADAPQSGENP